MAYVADTYIAKIDTEHPDPVVMALAGQVIRDGGLVAFPTETVYGLGANALSADAAQHIFEAKQRPSNDPLIVHIEKLEQLEQIAQNIPDVAYKLAEKFWAGALTLILPKHDDVPSLITAGQDTVAVRMPQHIVAQSLLKEAGVPIAAPSANRFSRPSPTSAQHVMNDLNGHVDIILDGGTTSIGVESTILDVTGNVPTVLRPGGITLEALREVLPTLVYRPRHILEGETAPAPGTLLKHYSPDATVTMYTGDHKDVVARMRQDAIDIEGNGQQVAILALDEDADEFYDTTAQIMVLGRNYDAMASHLFAGLRELDNAGIDVILVRAPEQVGVGVALYDRLMRAAEGQVVEVE